MHLLPPGRYQLVRVASRRPPSVTPPRGLCDAQGPALVSGATHAEPSPWADYALARRRGAVHPPSVSSRTAEDERRQARSVMAGLGEPASQSVPWGVG